MDLMVGAGYNVGSSIMFEIEIRQADGNRTVLIEKSEVVLGREQGKVDVDLNPDTSVSRVHARVWHSDAGIQIEDLNSSVGTIVNGDTLQTATVIQPTDVIQLGETVVRVLSKSSSKRRIKTSKAVVKEGGSVSGKASPYRLEFEVISKGKRTALKVPYGEAFIGRLNDEHQIDVDLSEDLAASRVHARVWVDQGVCWVEDLNSLHGVKVNEQPIKTATKLTKTDKIKIGSAQLRVQVQMAAKESKPARPTRGGAETAPLPLELDPPADGQYPVWKSSTFCCLPPEARSEQGVKFVQPKSTHVGAIRVMGELATDAKPEINALNKRKCLDYYQHLLEFSRDIGVPEGFNELYTLIVGYAVKALPGAERASLFLCDPEDRVLLLKAHVPNLKPAISPLLAQQSIAGGVGYIWKQCDKGESLQRLPIHSGLYAPLRNGKMETGLLCVDTTEKDLDYQPEDLSLLIGLAQIAASHIRLL